jgi:tetratricopeptide (TPR) repeat protein
MQGNMAGSAPMPAVVRAASLACQDAGLPGRWLARTLACQDVGKAQEFAPLRKSSSDFRAPLVHRGPPFVSSAALTAGKKTRMKMPSEPSRSRDRAGTAIDDVLQRGAKALEEQRAPEAERLARDALARNSRHPNALHLLGVALLMQERAREAVAPLEQAARERTNSHIETHLGKALLESGRASEALARLQRAIQYKPAFVAAFQELGILLCSMRRFDEAEAVLKRGLEAEPTSVELSLDLGRFYIIRADPKNAKVAFARALVNAPRHPRALHGSGVALLYEGEIGRAIERFRQVLAIEPGHLSAQLDLAHCLLQLGQSDDAIASLRAMVRSAPQHYGRALKALVSDGRGRFWIRRSAAARFLSPHPNPP